MASLKRKKPWHDWEITSLLEYIIVYSALEYYLTRCGIPQTVVMWSAIMAMPFAVIIVQEWWHDTNT